jgi:gliding motility-associated-like protein
LQTFILTYKKFCLLLACIMLSLIILSTIHAQTGGATEPVAMYIAPNAVLYVHNNAAVTVSSNVINSGVFGTVKGTTVNMLGNLWRNTSTGSFPDELGINSFTGTGGIFRFSNSRFPQYLAGGYSVSAKTGTSFPNLTVASPYGLYLDENTDTHIRNVLQMENGIFWLNGNNLLVGVTNPGTITGYTENRFIATENTSKGGYLYRSKISGASGSVVFPIGTQVGSYAPVAVMFNTGTPQDLHARVFDDIYQNAFLGPKGSPASVQQTWNIGQENSDSIPAIVALQHFANKEGAAFTAHRGNSYISLYDFTRRSWDTLGPSGFTSPGTLTTGTPQNGTYINIRSLQTIGVSSYLTKNADSRTDSITISKMALSPIRQPDGSYLVTYLFVIRNTGMLPAHSLQVLDTLTKVFVSPAKFAVSSVKATGGLVANNSFDGDAITDLLLPASRLGTRGTDTITLVLNVIPDRRSGYYYNNATVTGILNGFNSTQYVFSNQSVNGIAAPAPGTAPLPTPVLLSPAKYKMPEGFSPNGDGVNDKFEIGNLGIDNAAIWVFNKQGTLVYKNLAYHNDWDGSYNQNQGGQSSSKKVEDGTYFYKVVVTEAGTGKEETYYGFLSIWK